MIPSVKTTQLHRRPALDGVRGLAAFVVVLSHCLVVDERFADTYVGNTAPGSAAMWVVSASPLRLAWAGDAAVAVFFILSGYVLVRPFLHDHGGPWLHYYLRRLIRLYLPVWAALALTVLTIAAVPRTGVTGVWWVDEQAVPLSVASLLQNTTLIRPDSLLAQLWTLRWEVLFSLLLPAFVPAARWLARYGVGGFVPLIAANALGWWSGVEAVMYLSVFGFGALLAALEAARLRPVRRSNGFWMLVVVFAICAMTARDYPVLVVGAAVSVFLALECPPVIRAFTVRPLIWLGQVSYSLYLVHLPVVLATATLLGEDSWARIPLSVAMSVACASVFHRLVESPSQRLAARVRSARIGSVGSGARLTATPASSSREA